MKQRRNKSETGMKQERSKKKAGYSRDRKIEECNETVELVKNGGEAWMKQK